MKNKLYLFGIAFIGVMACTSLFAAESGDMALENTILRQRLDQLDREVEQLRRNASLQNNMDGTNSLYPIWSKLDIQFYGYVKLDASYDQSRIENGNYAQWVDSAYMSGSSNNDNDDQFNMTAKQTRLGFNISGPDSGDLVTSGKIEVDFYGSSSAENKAGIMMRHAYLKLDWPKKNFNIIAGQTSDVISPLFPSTINYSVGWWSGNIGYRRPQIRATKSFKIETGEVLKFEGALARTIGRDNTSLSGTLDSGEDSGTPTLQARVSMAMDTFGPEKATFGISGHYGEEEYDTNAGGGNKEFESWSINFDYTQPVSEKVTVKAELFKGQNLNQYLGGIGQGVNLDDTPNHNLYEEIGSKGGWIAASLGPWKNKNYNVGIAFDSADPDNLTENTGTSTSRRLNQSVFANVMCSLNSNVDVGFELSHWRTEYKGRGDQDSLRAQAALIYKF